MQSVYSRAPATAMLCTRTEQATAIALKKAGCALQVTPAGLVRFVVEEWLNRMVRDGGLDQLSEDDRVRLAWLIRSPIRQQRKSSRKGVKK